MRTTGILKYGPHDRNRLSMFLPDKEEFPVFIYFHGGGIQEGDVHPNPGFFANYLESRGVGLVTATYRLYPDTKYPEFIEDAALAVKWVFDNIGTYGKCKGIFVGGSSAGGYLSMMLQFDEKYLGAHGIKPVDIKGYIHDAGQPTAHFVVINREKNLDSRRVVVDETSPLYHVGTSPCYSPIIMFAATNDLPGRLAQLNLLTETLKHFRHPEDKVSLTVYEGGHVSYSCNDTPNGKDFAEKICDFIEKYMD